MAMALNYMQSRGQHEMKVNTTLLIKRQSYGCTGTKLYADSIDVPVVPLYNDTYILPPPYLNCVKA